jgi:hypothetical protein
MGDGVRPVLTVVIAVLLALCVPASPSRAAPAASPAVNLVLRYSFNSDATTAIADSSTHGITGQLINADPATAFVKSRAGKGKAIRLHAADQQYVAVPENDALDVDHYTLSAWVRYSGVTTAESRGRWEVLEKAGAFWLNIRTDGQVRAGGFFGGCEATQYWQYLDSGVMVPAQSWSHVAATYNGSRLAIYINGVRTASRAIAGTTCSNDEPLAVGAKNAPAKGILEAFWDGRLDEVRIYDRALRASRIAQIAS